MKVHARYFASLRERLGRAEEERETAPGTTPRVLLTQVLGATHAEYAAAVAFAVNHEYVAGDHPLQDGDEVAFLPPVSGG